MREAHLMARALPFIATAALLTIGSCSGCCPGQQCVQDTNVCDGGLIVHCGPLPKPDPSSCPETGTEWGPAGSCGASDLCVQGGGTAACVLSSAPVADCDPTAERAETCNAGAYTSCFFGKPIITAQCGWCGQADAGGACRGYIGDACDAERPCAPQAECHAFQDDGGGPTFCSRMCSLDTDCTPTTGVRAVPASGGDSAIQPMVGWPVDGPDPEYQCDAGWCVLLDPP